MTLLRVGKDLVDVDEALRELDRLDCEESLAHFLGEFWKYIDPAPFMQGWVVDALCEHLEAIVDGSLRHTIFNIPPRSLKSSLCSVAFPAWTWAQRWRSHTSGPGVKFLHASYADKLSVRDSVKCRRIIESPRYKELWGERFALSGDQNAKHRFSNDKGGERLITSIGAGVTGEGGDIIIIDDPNAANEVESAATIESTLEWWRGTMPTRLNDARQSAYIVIQQRLAENDLTGEILETQAEDWTHVMIPARYEPERSFVTSIGWKDPREEAGELYWPERFGEAELAKLERQLGKWRASGQLQQRPEPKGGGIIQRDYWQTWTEDAFPAFSFIVASLDTAFTEKTENDPSALTVWGIFSEDTTAQAQMAGQGITVRTYAQQTPKVMLMTAWAERLEIHALVKKVAETCKKMKVDKLLIENKASGQSVGQELRRLYNHENWSVQLVDPRGQDKTARLHSVAPIWEAGLVWAPDRTWSDMVITEMASFPKGKHDDLTDTASQAIRHIRDLGLLQFADEIQAEAEEEMRYKPQPKPLYPS